LYYYKTLFDIFLIESDVGLFIAKSGGSPCHNLQASHSECKYLIAFADRRALPYKAMSDFIHLKRTYEPFFSFKNFFIGAYSSFNEIVINKHPIISFSADHFGRDIPMMQSIALEIAESRANRVDDILDIDLRQGVLLFYIVQIEIEIFIQNADLMELLAHQVTAIATREVAIHNC
jgi:hypothetical protein